MKNIKMLYKLLLMFLITGLIPILAISIFSLLRSSGDLEQEVTIENNIVAMMAEEQLNDYFNKRTGDGQVLASAEVIYDGIQKFNDSTISFVERQQAYDKISIFLKVALEKNGYSEIYLTDRYGKVIFAANRKSEMENANLSGRDYIKSGLAGQQYWSDLFYSEIVKENIIALSTPVFINGKNGAVVGTLNIFVNQGKIDDIVHKGVDKLGQTGDSFLVDETGLLLSNTKQGEYTAGAALKQTINTKATQLLAKEIQGKNLTYTRSSKYKNHRNVDVIGTLNIVQIGKEYAGLVIEVDQKEAFASRIAMTRVMIIVIIISILAGLGLALLIAASINKPLKKVVAHSKTIAELDLSKELDKDYTKRKDEVGMIAQSIGMIQSNLREIIDNVRTSAEHVAASSEELTATAQESAATAEEVAKTIDEISQGASDQAANTEKGSELAIELGAIIEKDQGYLSSMNESSQQVDSLVHEGMEIIEELTLKTTESSRATQEVYNGIIKTNQSSVKIGQASSVIASIAEQTNMLALNAAIEAARAGEQGRGFAVVADEIRKLAEQSANSTKTIDSMVIELQSNADAAVKVMERVSVILKEQQQSVFVTKSKYEQIIEAIRLSAEAVQQLNISGKEMEDKKASIMDALQSLSAIAQQNAAGTEEANAAMEQQTAAIQEIANASTDLSSMAQDLQTVVGKFKL